MMAALDIRIICKFSFDKCFHSLVCVTCDTAVQLDSCFSKSILRTHADPAADQSIRTELCQEPRQCSMPASICIRYLFFCDLTIFYVIDFELFCVSEMLIYISVFKCYCYSHYICPFHRYRLHVQAGRPDASFLTEVNGRAVAQPVIPSRDQQNLSVYDAVRDLLPRAFIDFRYCSPGNIHPFCALFMRQLLQIDQPYHLILIDRQSYACASWNSIRPETAVIGFSADSPASSRSCHTDTPLSFPSYVENNIAQFSFNSNIYWRFS